MVLLIKHEPILVEMRHEYLEEQIVSQFSSFQELMKNDKIDRKSDCRMIHIKHSKSKK